MTFLSIFLMFRPKATFWYTLMLGNRLYCWNTIPIFRFLGVTSVMSFPSTYTLPVVTSSSPARQRSNVLLPQPEGPSRVAMWPFSTPMVIPFNTSLLPKLLCTSSNCIYPIRFYSFTFRLRLAESLFCKCKTSSVIRKVVIMMITNTALAFVLECFISRNK